jgi:hypothetical protein
LFFYISLSKFRINSKLSKSAFHIPHHVAMRIFVYAPLRRKLSRNTGANGDGFPARPEMV